MNNKVNNLIFSGKFDTHCKAREATVLVNHTLKRGFYNRFATHSFTNNVQSAQMRDIFSLSNFQQNIMRYFNK